MKNTEFGAIYARYRARSKRLARAILKNEDEAEDVCHDVFVKLYKMGEEFDTSSEKKMEAYNKRRREARQYERNTEDKSFVPL